MVEQDKYYTPTIEELTQGVKYEYLSNRKGEKAGGYTIIGEETVWSYHEEDEWIKREVWYDREPMTIVQKHDDGTVVTYNETDMWDLQPARDFTIRALKEGRIRIKKNEE